MSYCDTGQKAKITYKFGNGTQRIFTTDKTPIEVVSTEVSKNENQEDYDARGFTIIDATGARTTVINYRERTSPTTGQPQIQFWTCGRGDWDNRQPNGEYSVWYNLESPIVSIDRTVGCPPPLPQQNCQIKVYNSGKLIFSERGECPLVFSVSCGECPDGQCQHEIPNYPGYCCVDCEEVAKRIKTISNKVKNCCD